MTAGAPATVTSELLGSLSRLTLTPALTAEGRAYRALRAEAQAAWRRGDPLPAARAVLAW